MPDSGLVFGVSQSLSGRRWRWRTATSPASERTGLNIAQRLGVPEILGRLLALRGIGVEEAADFLEPTLRALLPNPSVLHDMDQAAERLATAVRRGERVAIFGDYDVDGACSAALMTQFLRGLGCEVIPYVPNRLNEGYGPNAAALESLVRRGARLIICVDCGTAAGEVFASVAGKADVIVLDHHQTAAPALPDILTVNPNRPDDRSGLGHVCAAGITFLAAVATTRCLRRSGFFAMRAEPDLLAALDLVALATVCDIVPLSGLNRALVAQGLKVMARRERPGLAALLHVAQVTDPPSAFTCGFVLGPRINAAGRIAEADLGLRLLLCEDPAEAQGLAALLDSLNRQRQHVEASVLAAATEAAERQIADGNAVLFVAAPAWHPGVVGIVAGRLKERFNRPSCVAGIVEGVAKGSGRSVPGLDLGAAVLAARKAGLLAVGGGHAMAAGFSLAAQNVADFHAFLNEQLATARHLPSASDLTIESPLAVASADAALGETLARLAPFGVGNDEPVFAIPHARVVRADRVGQQGSTIRAFVEGEGGGPRLKVMLFRAQESPLAEHLLHGPTGPRLHLAGQLRAESWNGQISASFVLQDAAWAAS
jgi:single-stranded-DNA-specific exonuclease